MDGVLVDNMRVHVEAFTAIARRYGVETDAAATSRMAGQSNEAIFHAFFPPEIVSRVGAGALGDEKEEIYRRIYAPSLAPARGLIAFLDDLRAHGVRIAIGTSAITANMDFVVDGLGIRDRFDAVVNIDMVSRAKPDPEIYLRALSELGLQGSECFVFEDALAGIEAARAAGIGVVALSTTLSASVLSTTPGVSLTVPDFTGLDFARLSALLSRAR